MEQHRDIDPTVDCGGQVASPGDPFNTDHWCVYCGAKWNDDDRKGNGMEKRHFELIARVLRHQRNADPNGRQAIERVAHRFADALAPTNPRFDRDRFIYASGFDPEKETTA